MTQASQAPPEGPAGRRRAGRRLGRGDRFGLLLFLLVASYLVTAFSSLKLTGDLQTALFAVVLLIAIWSSPLRRPVARAVGITAVAGSVAVLAFSLAGTSGSEGAAALWKSLMLLLTATLIVRQVLAKRTVTVQSIYGAISAYLILGLMFAAGFAAIGHFQASPFFAHGQPATGQTYQYFSFTTLTTLGYGDFTAVSAGGRAVAVLEALTGQVFLATLVARLVAAFRVPEERPPPAGDG
jgi:hypothetical protein